MDWINEFTIFDVFVAGVFGLLIGIILTCAMFLTGIFRIDKEGE